MIYHTHAKETLQLMNQSKENGKIGYRMNRKKCCNRKPVEINLHNANNSIMDFSLSNLEKSQTNRWQHFIRFYRLENNGHFKLQMICLSVKKSHINSFRKSVSVRCVFVFFQLTRNNSTVKNIVIFVSTDVVIPLVLFTNSFLVLPNQNFILNDKTAKTVIY